MEVLNKILVLLLLFALVVSLFAVLGGRDYIPISSILQNFEDNSAISTEWVNKINISVSVPDNAILQSLIDFVNQYLLLPIRLIMIICTMIINALSLIFRYIQMYFIT